MCKLMPPISRAHVQAVVVPISLGIDCAQVKKLNSSLALVLASLRCSQLVRSC
jgi:hypothetical protein